MTRMVTMTLTVCIALLFLLGCQESVSNDSDSALIQRARLIGNENIKLKKELEQKNEQIAQLQAQIEQIKTENTEATRKSGETNFKILQMFADAQKQNEAHTKENKELKAELEKLKDQ